jgi:hypothetical protein
MVFSPHPQRWGFFIEKDIYRDMKIVLTESQLKVLVEKYKIGDEERVKLHDTENFLLVAPLTHTASCKYGAGTKWCVTEKDPDMFERHYDMGSLGFLIIKSPELKEKLGNEKFAFYVNRPTSLENAGSTERIIVYDDTNSVIPHRSFLNFVDHMGVYPEIKETMNKFMEYANNKFNPNNLEMVKRGVQNPF